MKLPKRNKKELFLLITILFISAFFRLYKLKEWLFFGMDQEYEALIIRNILEFKHFPLIGVNASDTGLYLGPFFIYFAAIPYFLFSGSPIGGAIFAVIIGVITTYLAYYVGSSFYNKTAGLLAAVFYGASFLTSFYDRQFWNPTPVPLLSLLIGYNLYKYSQKDITKLPLLALLFGLSLHTHLSLLIFLPLFIYLIFKNYSPNLKSLFISVGIFLLTIFPLILFDVRHDFINIKALFRILYFSQSSVNVSGISERINIFLSALGRFIYTPAPIDLFYQSGQCRVLNFLQKQNLFLGTVIFLLLVIFYGKKFLTILQNKNITKHKNPDLFIGVFFLLTFVFILFYNKIIFEYYFIFLFPWLAILISARFTRFMKTNRGLLLISISGLIFIVINGYSLLTASFSYSYLQKQSIIKYVQAEIKDNNYSLEALGECTRYGGYLYLFSHYIKKPTTSYMENYFSWLDYDRKIEDSPKYIVLLSQIERELPSSIKEKWKNSEFSYLTNYNIVSQKEIGKSIIYILTDKK